MKFSAIVLVCVCVNVCVRVLLSARSAVVVCVGAHVCGCAVWLSACVSAVDMCVCVSAVCVCVCVCVRTLLCVRVCSMRASSRSQVSMTVCVCETYACAHTGRSV